MNSVLQKMTRVRQRWYRMLSPILPVVLATSCLADEGDENDFITPQNPQEQVEDGEEIEVENYSEEYSEEVIYRKKLGTLERGISETFEEEGDLGWAIQRRLASPKMYPDEDVYEDEAWSWSDGDGAREEGYQVINTHRSLANGKPYQVVSDGVATIDEELKEAIEAGSKDEEIQVIIELKGFPEWDIPLMPYDAAVSASTLLKIAQERQGKIQARRDLVDRMSTGLSEHVASLGGEVLNRRWGTGSVRVRIARGNIEKLVAREDIISVHVRSVVTQTDSLGDMLTEEATDAVRYHLNGQDGGTGNAAFHGYPELVGAIIDVNGIPQNPCFSMDARLSSNHQCTASEYWQRLTGRWECNTTGCNELTGSDQWTALGSHGTRGASIMLGDYDDCQGFGHTLGDSGSSGCHTEEWQEDSSGAAREARLVYVAMQDGNSPNSADTEEAIDMLLAEYPPDVINMSYQFNSSCTPNSSYAGEDSAENAFDSGVFVVSSAGNCTRSEQSCTTSDQCCTGECILTDGTNRICFGQQESCNVVSPADTPKVWAVNAVRVGSGCTYGDCTIATNAYRQGNGTVPLPTGGTAVLDMIDSAAPDGFTNTTRAGVPYGTVDTNRVIGTSFAAPLLGGLALLVKGHFLSTGNTWVNNPGRLHAIMANMHDRATSTTLTGATTTARADLDKRYGNGRVKLRMFKNSEIPGGWGWTYKTKTFVQGAQSPYYKRLKSTPLPSDIDLVKCNTMLSEDMSSKNYVNNVETRLYVGSPNSNGTCSATPSGASVHSSDTAPDVKLMVSSTFAAGKCVWLQIDPDTIGPSGVTTTNFCSWMPVMDDEAQQ